MENGTDTPPPKGGRLLHYSTLCDKTEDSKQGVRMVGFNDLVWAMFEGYKEAKKDTSHQRKMEEMKRTSYLFSSAELNDLYKNAETDDDYNAILDHMYRHDATEVSSYRRIEKKIINHMWEE
jgi:hypothetical protein